MQWATAQSVTSSVGTSERSGSDASSLSDVKFTPCSLSRRIQDVRNCGRTKEMERDVDSDSLAHSLASSSIGDSLKFECDQSILANRPELNNQRRTVVVTRASFQDSFGFALQSYTYRRENQKDTERVTYIDYVRSGSPASKAGIRRGDVVIAVNNSTVIGIPHSELVDLMSRQLTMRLVLLFQNVARIVALQARSLQLQYILAEKMKILEKLEEEERAILRLSGRNQTSSYPRSGNSDCSISSIDHLELQTFDERELVEEGPSCGRKILPPIGTLAPTLPHSPPPSRILGTHKFQIALTHLIRVDISGSQSADPEVTRL